MQTKNLNIQINGKTKTIDLTNIHTLIIGSGAAGLNAAVQLYRRGIEDILIITEGLQKGTSINTGSDKQTYYKLSICGADEDSPSLMAESYTTGGAMHGDLALIEAGLSVQGFMNLISLGVPFPYDKFGQYIGYKTDHDPRQRATSVGPYTSREMCRCLIQEVKRLGIPVIEDREVIQLIKLANPATDRIVGAITMDSTDKIEAYAAENIVFAVGGPGGLYKTSVYPQVHTGAIGLALMVGAEARNLPESQFGLASIGFRWNVSGTYMQVIPRFISRAADGISDEREFLLDYFSSPSEMYGNVFLKGYQWPFDARKVEGGSSIIDILVYIETVEKGRRVYLDFMQDPQNYSLDILPEEAFNYLDRSGANQSTPFERLNHMNPGAIELYRDHGIDIESEPLEIAVCAQHNNGGLAANIWAESTNFKHFFSVGEVNGSHGVNRPGGTALNAGQVWSIRAANYIAACYQGYTLSPEQIEDSVVQAYQNTVKWIDTAKSSNLNWQDALNELQARMSRCAAHIRSKNIIEEEIQNAKQLVSRLFNQGCSILDGEELRNAFKIRQLAVAHRVYLEAIYFMLDNQVGSRGSSIVIDPDGNKFDPRLDDSWKIQPEDPSFRQKALITKVNPDYTIKNEWEAVRPIPEIDAWFETAWAAFRNKDIFECS